jgi:lysozyme
MNTDDQILIQELRRDEGVRYEPYLDTVKVWTIGVGHNMQTSPLPKDWEIPITDAQVDALLAKDLTMVFSDLDRKLPWWRSLSYARQRVMANMCFNLGINGLCTFVNTLALINTGRYKEAATGMLSSKWARQVGDRAKRLSVMMEQG